MYPFAHASTLRQHINGNVTVIGQVSAVQGDTATVDANGPISVKVSGPCEAGKYYRFLGKVLDDNTVAAYDTHEEPNVGDFDAAKAARIINAMAGQQPFY